MRGSVEAVDCGVDREEASRGGGLGTLALGGTGADHKDTGWWRLKVVA
jgi:hypothetical protein